MLGFARRAVSSTTSRVGTMEGRGGKGTPVDTGASQERASESFRGSHCTMEGNAPMRRDERTRPHHGGLGIGKPFHESCRSQPPRKSPLLFKSPIRWCRPSPTLEVQLCFYLTQPIRGLLTSKHLQRCLSRIRVQNNKSHVELFTRTNRWLRVGGN